MRIHGHLIIELNDGMDLDGYHPTGWWKVGQLKSEELNAPSMFSRLNGKSIIGEIATGISHTGKTGFRGVVRRATILPFVSLWGEAWGTIQSFPFETHTFRVRPGKDCFYSGSLKFYDGKRITNDMVNRMRDEIDDAHKTANRIAHWRAEKENFSPSDGKGGFSPRFLNIYNEIVKAELENRI